MTDMIPRGVPVSYDTPPESLCDFHRGSTWFDTVHALQQILIMTTGENEANNEEMATQTLFNISFLLLLLLEYIIIILYQYVRTYQHNRANELNDIVKEELDFKRTIIDTKMWDNYYRNAV